MIIFECLFNYFQLDKKFCPIRNTLLWGSYHCIQTIMKDEGITFESW